MAAYSHYHQAVKIVLFQKAMSDAIAEASL